MKGVTLGVLVLLALSTSWIDLCVAECDLPNPPSQGSLIYQSGNRPRNQVSEGYTIRVVCNEPQGFRLHPEGDGFMTCTDSGWSAQYDCIDRICPRLPEIPNGIITYRLRGTVARYSCVQGTGTRLEGVRKRRCQEDDTWSEVAPRCRPIPRCPLIELPPNVQNRRLSGRFREDLWTIGSIHTFSCQDERYTLDLPRDSYPAIQCRRDGWNGTVPTCIEVSCPPILDEIQNGRSTAENRTYSPKESIEFVCDAGYRTTSPSWRVCNLEIGENGRPTGEWQGVTPRCEVTTCPRLNQIENGVTISDSVPNVGANGTFRCNSGYTLIGDSRLTCLSTGQWNGSVPVCDSDDSHCPALAAPLNGDKRGDRYHRFATVTFSCNLGYALIGSEERRCRKDGQWSGELTRCMGPKDFDDVNQIAAVLGEQLDGLKETALIENEIEPVATNASNNRSRFIPLQHKYGVDLYFMFDSSKSVGEINFEKAKKFAKELVKEIGVNGSDNSLRVGAMYFNSGADIAFHTVTYQSTERVVKAIDEIQYKAGGTNIAGALELVRTIMIPQSELRAGSFRTVFLITDGEATEGGSPLPNAIALEEMGVKIHCLGVSEDANKLEISKIASEPKREYLFFLKDYDSLGPLIKAVTNQTQDYTECGMSKFTVPTGGETDESPAREGAWPWQILIQIYKNGVSSPLVCGGTLLRDDTILTAAHCVNDFDRIEVAAGITDRLNKDRAQVRTIHDADVTIHENFDYDTLTHDIALIRVDPPFQLSPNVRPACLPDPAKENRLLHRGAAIVTGWGHQDPVHPNAVEPYPYQVVRYLQQLTLPLRTRDDCEDNLVGDPEANWFDDSMTCAGYLNKQLGACQGDSGGPLMKYANNGNRRQWTVIGISSWGRGCAWANELDFFTNVPRFVDWINLKMNPPAAPTAAPDA